MIELMLRVLLAIATGGGCDMGKPVDYYQWVDAHPDYTVPMTLETDVNGDWWLMSDEGEYLLFKFATDIEDTLDSGTSTVHGECASVIQ